MTVLLPILFLVIIWPILAARHGEKTDRHAMDPWGEALLAASIILGLAVVASNELLSLWGVLDHTSLTVFWSLAIVAAGAVGWKLGFARPRRLSLAFLSSFGWFEKTILILLVAVMAILGLIALLALPTTGDSMTYHLARVAHWQQNRSIAFYPTAIMRQNHPAPLAEWLMLQLRILSGSYQLVNLVQWCAMVGSVIGVPLIARRMGGSARARLLAAVFAATLPMGIVQATSTQNDYVAGFWLVCLVLFGLQAIESPTPWRLILMAGSLALALLTKGTTYFFAFPFVIWFGVALLRRMGRSAWQPVLISVALVLLVNGGHFTRNYRLYGNPLGPDREVVGDETFTYGNEVHGIRPTVSNLARNLALHLATPIPAWNRMVFRAVTGFHRLLGADPNDPRTTWVSEPFLVNFRLDEDLAGNPLHMLFFGLTVLILIYRLSRKRFLPAPLLIYLCCLAGAAVSFCAMLRWQPWHSRLHLPLFLLAAPSFALILAGLPFWKFTAWPAMAVLVLATLPYVAGNGARPVFGPGSVFVGARKDRLVRNHPVDAYLPMFQFIANQGCHQVGLMMGGDDWEFPVWLVQEELVGSRIRFEHVGVSNVTRTLGHPSNPDYVLVFGQRPDKVLTVDGRRYTLAFLSGSVVGYKSQE